MSLSARVLVVEDDPKMAQFICFKLNYLGYEVAGQATSENSAVEMAAQLNPDLILMDIMLDDGDDGIEAANRIIADRDVPIVYLTAHEDDALFERAKTTRPFGYLTKPFNDRDLNLVIETATYRQSQKQKLARALDETRSIINSTFVMIITTTLEGRIIEFNPSAEWELGYSHKEASGQKITDLILDNGILIQIKERLSEDKRIEIELPFTHKSGEIKNNMVSVSNLKLSDDDPVGYLFISH